MGAIVEGTGNTLFTCPCCAGLQALALRQAIYLRGCLEYAYVAVISGVVVFYWLGQALVVGRLQFAAVTNKFAMVLLIGVYIPTGLGTWKLFSHSTCVDPNASRSDRVPKWVLNLCSW